MSRAAYTTVEGENVIRIMQMETDQYEFDYVKKERAEEESRGGRRGRRSSGSSVGSSSAAAAAGGRSSSGGKRGDMRAKLERSRQSARECRARKKLRYQYLEELVADREKAVLVLRNEVEVVGISCPPAGRSLPEERTRLRAGSLIGLLALAARLRTLNARPDALVAPLGCERRASLQCSHFGIALFANAYCLQWLWSLN
ncbi:hypothetical protein HPB48_003159 [Haemaphysalis longicornis]|uniref:BZIP domain-containing protein n=1 Tax=Haemaphysalis longicornis TaxID=44386 RepID=A0A9J6GRG1_HAELO|nr:hypothetical protein HPB48_003159 [Haemaphysalis longicornis]